MQIDEESQIGFAAVLQLASSYRMYCKMKAGQLVLSCF